ncbi:MAG: hypothetical protein R2712_01355 [Vicinamibacterales bacterium]
MLPYYDIGLAANLNAQSGILLTRQINTPLSVGGTTTVNVEPPGPYRLDQRTSIDLRAFKTVRFSGAKELEASIDFNNLMNNNVAWDARSLGGTINLRQDGSPTGAINTLPQFGSPSSVTGTAEHPLQRRVPLLIHEGHEGVTEGHEGHEGTEGAALRALRSCPSCFSRVRGAVGDRQGRLGQAGVAELESSRNSMRVQALSRKAPSIALVTV